ncbi:MAG: hypothetical protein N3D11_14445 [Candidatus Sumerlaeia bacterium]|nr:hypothetical protein [Candidatus Sumerlaeia bacterium]
MFVPRKGAGAQSASVSVSPREIEPFILKPPSIRQSLKYPFFIPLASLTEVHTKTPQCASDACQSVGTIIFFCTSPSTGPHRAFFHRKKRLGAAIDSAGRPVAGLARIFCQRRATKRPLPRVYQLALVDLVSMAYGCFEADLVGARMMFFDAPWWAAFCEDYFAGASDRRSRFEQNAAVFFADFFLTKASRQASSVRKAQEKGRREEAEIGHAKCLLFWQMLCACADGGAPWKFNSGDGPAQIVLPPQQSLKPHP